MTNMNLKMGLTGLAMLVAGGACTTTRIITQKGTCAVMDLDCDVDKNYLPSDPCYDLVQKWHQDNPVATSSRGGSSSSSSSSSSSRADRDGFDKDRSYSNKSSSGRETRCYSKH